MTTTESKTKVLNLIKKDFGKSFTELKKDILKTLEFGASKHFKSELNGYSIFYTENNNFMGGIKNGGGKGFFAKLNGVGVSYNVKLSN